MMMKKILAIPIMLIALLAFTQPTVAGHGHDHGKGHALKHGGGEECDLHKKKECDKKSIEECELKNREDCEKHRKKECDKKGTYKQKSGQGHGYYEHGKRGFDVLNIADKIGLSKEQVKKIKDIKFEHKKDEVITNAEIKVLKITLRAMSIDYSTEIDTYAEKVREMEAKKSSQKIARFNMKKEIRNLMTTEQRERVRAHFEKKDK